MDLNIVLLIFSAVSFIFYGITSFFSKRMVSEYARWGYSKHRILLGCMQLLGGIGLLIGITNSTLLSVASFLLTFMMITAVFVRIKIKDSLINMFPALNKHNKSCSPWYCVGEFSGGWWVGGLPGFMMFIWPFGIMGVCH